MKKQTQIVLAVLLSVLALVLGYLLGAQQQVALSASNSAPPVEFTAPLNAIPEEIFGTWQIGGYEVIVTHKTDIRFEPHYVNPGALVHVRAHDEARGLVAERVELVQDTPYTLNIHGPVSKIQDGFWIVGNKRIKVLPKTRISHIDGPPLGRIASVQVHVEGDTFVADAITLTTRTDEAAESEFIGQLEEVRGNIWVINGVNVQVRNGTSAPPIGTMVRVRGRILADGTLQSEELAVKPTEVRIKGWIVGQEAENVWQVLVEGAQGGGTQRVNVRVDSNAPVDEREGMMQAGAHVEVAGITETPNEIRATFVRVLNKQNTYLIGTLIYIPSGDRFSYPWTVDETQVWVTPNTLSDKPLDSYRLGDRVAVFGFQQEDGSIAARMISPSKR